MKKIGIIISVLLIVGLIVAIVVATKIDVSKIIGLENDSDYKEYSRLVKNNEVDSSGEYIIKYADPDKVRVSFAKNKALEVKYYSDEANTKEITQTVYLNPGETVYVKLTEAKGSDSNFYKFSRYEIYEITDEHKKERIIKLTEPETKYTIPENFEGKEIQIVPFGEHQKSSIPLSAFWQKGENNRVDVNLGNWFKNDEKISGTHLTVGLSEMYTLKYDYNEDEYFFISSSPECFSFDLDKGEVEFKSVNSSDSDHPTEYNVELKKYFTLTFKFDENANISLNDDSKNEEAKKLIFGKNYELDESYKLKYDDIITIETDGNIQIIDGDYQYISATRDEEGKEYKYTYIITIKAENFDKELSEKTCPGLSVVENVTITLPSKDKYGTYEYKVNSKQVEDGHDFKEGDKLKITYTITKEGYVFSEQSLIDRMRKTKKKTETVTITKELDGTTLKMPEQFKVKKEG